VLSTVVVSTADCSTLPAWSVATTRTSYWPSVKLVVSQLALPSVVQVPWPAGET